MISDTVVELSRWQFAITALYHFLFVPLTIGLSFIVAIMESVYVITGRTIYRDMTQFWGKIFGINFALGIATGLTMEFQFGSNWAYYSHYVGDVFGAPLAIEGLVAFFLESTFVGLFFFGWDKLSKFQHVTCTWLVAIGSNLSALFILVANAWMNHPLGANFNPDTMRMEMSNFGQLLFNPVAQVKFIHTVSAGYATASTFVLSVSAYYIVKNQDVAFARRSFAIASGFGLAAILSTIVLGDESGYAMGDVQQVKLAAIEAEWDTYDPPAPFTLFGIPDQEAMKTYFSIKIPWALGIIATRTLDEEVTGIKDLIKRNEERIRDGIRAHEMIEKLRLQSHKSPEDIAAFKKIQDKIGYGLMLYRYTNDISTATDEQIKLAAHDTIPWVLPLFFSFRIMVGIGLFLLILFATAFVRTLQRVEHKRPFMLKVIMYSWPLPWIAAELGWYIAECGRQPWAIAGILPTFYATSSLSPWDLYLSLALFIAVYTGLFVLEVYLMQKYAKRGPSVLQTGRYHFEKSHDSDPLTSMAPPPMQKGKGPAGA